MKRAATHLFKRQSKNRAFFEIIELLLWFKTSPGADPRARQRSENPTPGATRMLRIARSLPGEWSGLELTDTVLMHYASLLFSFKYFVYHQAHRDSKHIHHICPINFNSISIQINEKKFSELGSSPELHHTSEAVFNMRIKGYSQLTDIVNFCGKQHNISSFKKHMALIYCQWSNDLGFITRSSNNFCLS